MVSVVCISGSFGSKCARISSGIEIACPAIAARAASPGTVTILKAVSPGFGK